MAIKVLITGGTGALGSVLVSQLTRLGHTVRVLTLPGDKNAPAMQQAGIDVRFGDVSRREDLTGICDGVTTVLHCAAIILTNNPSLYTSINADGTRNMADEAVRAGVSHFIHISSASVVYPHTTPYSVSKRLGEEFVTKSSLSWTIVRPTLICGKRGGQEFDIFLNYLERFPIVPFIGRGAALKRPVFVDDVADGLVKLACLEKGTGKIYNFSGATSISISDFARHCLVLMGNQNKPIVHVPVWSCTMAAAILKRIMKDPQLKWNVIAGITQDANLDPAEAIRDIGYKPRGVEQTLQLCFPRDK
ncbi:MAG: NAD(P)-dependent oxidoreductase [Chitinispirillaceae bacterium]|jgi:NADH dehydrogenase|nr:NAD(P)-dependent oxidoreductase [Chitinispirillaceae bacterium]